ncbi:enhancer of mRNA-decapping protein 4-like [Tasmannia lanceolata]|uniref:enhancer of mRNA-decapping protein 4-like n=1 Tax=Tasmannia lanceolata TaxID=3420 RepID=UPI004064BA1C
MASAGNPNQPGAFDMQMLFRPSNPSNPNPAPFPPSSYNTPTSSYPSPPGPFSYSPQTTPFHHYLHYPQDPLANVLPQRPISYPTPPNPNPGARLMALLGTNPPPNLELPFPSPPSSSPSSAEFSMPLNPIILPTIPIPSAPPVPQPSPPRLPSSSKLPKGRHLIGDHLVYDVDVRLPGEVQPQLEVTPITKYFSDPGLVVGRQIAVNRTYICYGLKLGAIRVLNINTALRSLLRGHTQRVTDMAFFAEDVHLLASASIDGRVFVWKINEGPDEEEKPQITGKIIIAIQIVGEGEPFHPRVCWHSHKQEVLVIGIGKRLLKIDTTKVGKGEVFSAEEPIKCPIEKLIDGVQLIGEHEGEVTDLSMCQWMTTRLVSASTDGTVKIWEDRKALPLVTLRPHDGQPVNSVTFLTAPHRPDHIVLITAGDLNREVKVWASASQEGWLLPSDAESWQCTQTFELISSLEPRAEEAFFNQVVAVPRTGLILLANAKKNAIYAVHVDYGPYPSATRMDYIAEFTVTMPILSLTGTSDCPPDGEHVVQVYCVQTQAIQQYALDLSQCLPLPLEHSSIDKDPSISRAFEAPVSDGFNVLEEPSHENSLAEPPVGGTTPKPPLRITSDSALTARYPAISSAPELSTLELSTTVESKSSALPPTTADIDSVHIASPPVPLSPRLSGRLAGFRSPSNSFEPGHLLGDRGVDQPVLDYSVERRVDAVRANYPDVHSVDESSGKDKTKVAQNDISMVQNPPITFKHPTHLITPSEILSMVVSSSENTHVAHGLKEGEAKIQDVVVNNDAESVEVEVKVVGESGSNQRKECDSQREQRTLHAEKRERSFYTQASDLTNEMGRDCCALPTEILCVEETPQVEDVSVSEGLEQPLNTSEEEVQETTKDVPGKVSESSMATGVAQSPSSASKGKKQKAKPSQVSGPSSSSPSPFQSTDSINEPGSSSSVPSTETVCSQILAMQDMLNQLMAMQKEMQKQMAVMVAVPVNKEGRRVEAALGRSMEKAVKANIDTLWARLQEENAKHEKLERDRIQQITSLMSNCMNKDLPVMLDKFIKKEISAVAPAVARAITPIVEKTISSAITESFQRGVGDKAVGQLEKSVTSKLEASVARQIQVQFQTSGKQALQDVLRSSLESSMVPAFEMSCKSMFDQVDATFQKGMIEHTTATQQQFDSAHSPVALALRDAMSSASSITRSLSGELADGHRKLLALVASGATQKAINPIAVQQSNGPLGGLHEMALSMQQIEAPVDPTKELQRLISERKYGEAFTAALQRSDVSIVSWLCSQVDLAGILSMVPLPLGQGVLLALLQQLACDLGNETSRKLEWMRDVAIVINPADPMIAMHVRPILEQVYQILAHQRTLPTITPAEANSIRIVMHVINSVLTSCK